MYIITVVCSAFSHSAYAISSRPPIDTVKALTTGDHVPDITINNLINYPKTSAKISDFKGKLLIVDFWATWCSPCVAMIPKMDSLQNQFADKVQFLSVTYQSKTEIEAFLNKLEKKRKHSDLIQATNDSKLAALFPHTTFPHYVWIDSEGSVKAITELQQVNADNIKKLLNYKTTRLTEKKTEATVAYDQNRPLFLEGNGGTGHNLLFHSMLTGYAPGLELAGSFTTDSIYGKKIALRNLGVRRLFQLAFSEPGKVYNQMNTVVEVKDASKLYSSQTGNAYADWLRSGNGFCYELIVPLKLASQSNRIMQQDLSRYFSQYTVKIEPREQECLVLTRTSGEDKLKSKGGNKLIDLDSFGYHLNNAAISTLIYRLNFTQRAPKFLVDETGYTGRVDLRINASLPDLNAVNQELEKYDLKLIEAKRTREVLVIRDTTSP